MYYTLLSIICGFIRYSFKDQKHLVFGYDEFPHFLVEYLDCCIAQDKDEDHEYDLFLTVLLVQCVHWL